VIIDRPHKRQLSASELALLRTLEDGWPRTRVELAGETGLLPAAAAGMLRKLAAQGLVARGASWQSVGQWRLTQSGIRELGAWWDEVRAP
jgi:DNA-binding IclR family transcriptional regulator